MLAAECSQSNWPQSQSQNQPDGCFATSTIGNGPVCIPVCQLMYSICSSSEVLLPSLSAAEMSRKPGTMQGFFEIQGVASHEGLTTFKTKKNTRRVNLFESRPILSPYNVGRTSKYWRQHRSHSYESVGRPERP